MVGLIQSSQTHKFARVGYQLRFTDQLQITDCRYVSAYTVVSRNVMYSIKKNSKWPFCMAIVVIICIQWSSVTEAVDAQPCIADRTKSQKALFLGRNDYGKTNLITSRLNLIMKLK